MVMRRFGAAIQDRRQRDGCSREELAHRLSVSVRTLARLEAGELDPRLGLLLDMEREFPGLLGIMLACMHPVMRMKTARKRRPGLAKAARKR